MKKRFTEEQIIRVLKEAEAGAKDERPVPNARDQRGDVLQLEGQVWRHGRIGREASEASLKPRTRS